MKKKLYAFIAIVLILGIVALLFASGEVNRIIDRIEHKRLLENIGQIEWRFTGDDIFSSDNQYYQTGFEFHSEDATEVDISLSIGDGVITITDNKTGDIYEGSYQPIEKKDGFEIAGDFVGEICGETFTIAVYKTEYRDYRTDDTGFDGTEYGKYALALIFSRNSVGELEFYGS